MNERDFEETLGRQRARTPSDRLEERMDALFDAAELRSEPFFSVPIPLWQCAVACLLFAAAGYGLNLWNREEPAPGETVYVILLQPSDKGNAFDMRAAHDGFLLSPDDVEILVTEFTPNSI